MEKLPNIHPGEVLLEEFLIPLGISQYRLAKDLKIPQTRVSEIVKRKRRITADTALRLSKHFGTSAKFWLGLQDDFDIEESANLLAKDLTEIPEMKKKRGLTLHTSSMTRIRSLCRACPPLATMKNEKIYCLILFYTDGDLLLRRARQSNSQDFFKGNPNLEFWNT